MKKPKLIIYGDLKRKHAAEAVEDFKHFAVDKAEIISDCFRGSCPAEILAEADFAIVFGGDGTILSAARDLSETNVPVIGVNVGKLGFLAEFSVEELEKLFDDIINNKTPIEKRMILNCWVEKDGSKIFSSTAINDMIIAAGVPFKMIELEMSVEGQSLAGFTGDGIIISTPTGSTAYNLSSGGPILSADLSAIVITPVCPHSLSFRPVVINAENIVQIQPIRINEGTTITLDGQVSHKLGIDDVVRVQRGPGSFLVVNNPMRTQWDTLASKLNWARKPKYNMPRDNSAEKKQSRD